MTTQPTLPDPVPFTELEEAFIAESPPNLWPENQDSNFGAHRRALCNRMQEIADQIQTIFNERFIDSSNRFLPYWEDQMGMPVNPPGRSVATRRSLVLTHFKKGAFTFDLIKGVIEPAIQATFGTVPALTPPGLPIGAGIPLHAAGGGDVTQYYRIYQDIQNFTYIVRIVSSVTPDTPSLLRELTRITPEGITYTFDNSLTNILSYPKQIIHDHPNVYYGLGAAYTDSSGFNNTATAVGAPSSLASPGLLTNAAVAESSGGRTFDGATQYLTVPDAPQLHVGDVFSAEFWLNTTDFATNRFIIDFGGSSFAVYVDTSGFINLVQRTGSLLIAKSTIPTVAGTTYHVVVTKAQGNVKIYINGVDRTGTITNRILTDNTSSKQIAVATGTSNYYKGSLDEVAVYNYPLAADKVLLHYNTGKSIA